MGVRTVRVKLPSQVRVEWRPVLLLAALFGVIMLCLGLNRYYSFFSSYDHGIFNQVFWNNLHGRWFESSLSSDLSSAVVHENQPPRVDYHRLGQHFTPALLLWLPFYALAPSAGMLTVIQVTLVTIAGIVLYVLARHYVQPGLALFLQAGYYSANAVIGPTVSNFHDLCQIPLFIFTLLLALEKRIWWLVWLMAVLTLAVREDAGVVLFGVGFYMVVSRRFPRSGLAMCILAFGYILFCTNVLMPAFSDDISRRFMLERFGQFARDDEATTLETLWLIVSQPGILLSNFLRDPQVKLFYVLIQTLPLAFVPLRTLYPWTIAGFPFLQLLLQRGDSPLALHIRYAMTLVPGLFYGAILWWSTHRDRFRPKFRRFWAGCLALSLLLAIAYNPHDSLYFAIPTSFRPWVYVSLPQQWHHASQIHQFIRQIPPDAGVSATRYVVPHISGRRAALRFPSLRVRNDQNQVVDMDYILADLWQLERYRPIFRTERLVFSQVVPLIDRLLAENRYGLIGLADKVVFLQKGVVSTPELLTAWQDLRQEFEPLLQEPIKRP
jgi:uncharacterized membrane protein